MFLLLSNIACSTTKTFHKNRKEIHNTQQQVEERIFLDVIFSWKQHWDIILDMEPDAIIGMEE